MFSVKMVSFRHSKLFCVSYNVAKSALLGVMDIRNSSNSSVKTYDLIVIGGGSGGLACAKEAVLFGKEVAVLDFVTPSPQGTCWGLGGTCVNVGCIPKKLMHHISQMKDVLRSAHTAGWSSSHKPATTTGSNIICDPILDWSVMAERVQDYIKSLNWGHRVALRDKQITYYNAKASFVDKNTIKAVDKKGEETQMKAKFFVIAVGGRPKYPDIPGAKQFGITSDDIFWLKKAPGKTLVVGASYVALECAGFLQAFGCDTTVMVRSIPLRGFDQQMANSVTDYMENESGISFIRGCEPKSVSKQKDGSLQVTWKPSNGAAEMSDIFDTVMFAVGREPCTDALNLPAAGVATHQSSKKILGYGGGKNQDVEQTSSPHVYALGDALQEGIELTPVAIRAGKLLARRIFSSSKEQMQYGAVATTVFTPLEYSCVGLTEDEALAKLGGTNNVEVYHCFYKPLEFVALGSESTACYIKMVCDRKKNDTVVGLHILGVNSGEIMQGFAVAIRMGVTRAQLCSTVGIHPTSAEEVVKLHITKRSRMDPQLTGC